MKKEKLVILLIISALAIALGIYAYHLKSIKTQEVPMFNTLTGGASQVGIVMVYVMESGQIIELLERWNFVSFFVKFQNKSVDSIFQSINPYYDFILEWNSSAQNFKIWSRNGQKEFTEINENMSYFIYMNTGKNLTVTNVYFENLTLPLVNGWEAPVYPYKKSSNITGNQFYNATFQYILKWNWTDQIFLVYSPQSLTPEFTSIKQQEGYFIKTAGGNLVYVPS